MNRTSIGLGTLGIAIATCAMTASPALAGTLVSTELVLSVDVSGSINTSEFNLQRNGYANAFRDDELISLIEGLNGGIAVTLQYWSTRPSAPLGWFHIVDRASAYAFADAISVAPRPSGTYTNVAAAINSAANLLSTNDFDGDRQVIDISGDGKQNRSLSGTTSCGMMSSTYCTSLVTTARDAAVAKGMTINGLPILTDVASLDDYFLDYAIGGDGAFVQAAATFSDFELAVKTKIKREIIPEPKPETVPEPSLTVGLLLGLLGGRFLLEKRSDRA